MNPVLRNFYSNEAERDAVKEFMIEVLKELAVERTFDGKPVTGIPEARELVDRLFDKLQELYGKIKEPVISNSR